MKWMEGSGRALGRCGGERVGWGRGRQRAGEEHNEESGCKRKSHYFTGPHLSDFTSSPLGNIPSPTVSL